jgi:chromosomal replication initiation ATPase DnaA
VTALTSAIERSVLGDLIEGTGIVGYREGEVLIAAPDPARAEPLATTYRDLIERKLSQAMRRPIRIAVVSPDDGEATAATGAPSRPSRRAVADPSETATTGDGQITPPSFVVAECGLWSGQVWAAVLSELERHEAVGQADFAAWLRSTLPLGRGGDGGPGSPLVVGVPHALAQRRVSSRFQDVIAGVVSGVVGVALPVEIVVVRDWLAQYASAITAEDEDNEMERAIGA